MANFDPFAEFRMEDHSVIVTGGAQNIGAAVAKTLAGAGAKVMIADLNGDKAEATAAEIEKVTGSQAIGMKCDVTSEADIQACVDATAKAFGGISTLVNNVGWGAVNPDPLAVEGAFSEVGRPSLGAHQAPHHPYHQLYDLFVFKSLLPHQRSPRLEL
jgi:NAD(P)-dependent dehydrogenase (short-subunit alcohol dehydrogenase family)